MAKSRIDGVHGLRFLEPGPTVLVTSMFRSQPNVMTAAWLSPLGFDPPIIGLSIHPGRLTHELVTKSEMFGISVPTMDLLREVHQCGMASGRELDKFEMTGLTPIDPYEIEAPRIDECVAHLECGVIERLSVSDHDLFIGEILVAEADDRHFRDRWIADDEIALIHHVAAEYYAGLTRAYAISLDDEEE
jgi:flavin reductase (DIM6/NTAB) family NADH-FMN oxidoreductase RutF